MSEKVKVFKINFVTHLQIGPTIDVNYKRYLNGNTATRYKIGDIKNHIFEFRFIDGRRSTYEEPYEDFGFNELTDKIINYIKPVRDFIDIVIVYIRNK